MGTEIKMQYGDFHNVGMVIEDLNPFLVKRIQKVTRTFKDPFKDSGLLSMNINFKNSKI
jgi:hypothetical protein